MADRLVRDEILSSERWLDLPSDTDRLAYFGLLLQVDDFGNLEGGTRRLYRFLQAFTQVKTAEAAATVMLHLADADMVRQYQAEAREYYHLPRLRPHRQYIVRKYPPSPWDSEQKLGKDQRIATRGIAKTQLLSGNVATTSRPSRNDVAQGVGVGVGGTTAADAASSDPRKLIFDLGVRLLTANGTAASSARSFLAKYAKDGNGGEPRLAEIIGHLSTHPKIEPKAYIVAAMRAPDKDQQMAKKLKAMP